MAAWKSKNAQITGSVLLVQGALRNKQQGSEVQYEPSRQTSSPSNYFEPRKITLYTWDNLNESLGRVCT